MATDKPAPPSTRHIPGEAGVWVFILGDLTVFAVMFGAFLYARTQDPGVFSASRSAHMSVSLGVVNTLLLLTSSLAVYAGVEAARRGQHDRAPRFFTVGMVLGLGFVVVKYFEYSAKLRHGIDPSTNDFWMYYFVLTGIHLGHLLIGLGVMTWLRRLAARPLDVRGLGYLEGGACFWHMVDALWIVLFALLYLVV